MNRQLLVDLLLLLLIIAAPVLAIRWKWNPKQTGIYAGISFFILALLDGDYGVIEAGKLGLYAFLAGAFIHILCLMIRDICRKVRR